jgi:two-component system response regulator YesN
MNLRDRASDCIVKDVGCFDAQKCEDMKVKKSKTTSLSDRVVGHVLTRKTEELAVLTVEGTAKHLGVNRSHLSRTFRSEKDFTIEEFIFKIKIIRAAALIKERPDLTIKKVAKCIGFCRCDYFIRVFKRYFGTTPAKYRALVRH